MPEKKENPEKEGLFTVTFELPEEISILLHIPLLGESNDDYRYHFGEDTDIRLQNFFIATILQRFIDRFGMEKLNEMEIDLADYNMHLVDGQVKMKTLVCSTAPKWREHYEP